MVPATVLRQVARQFVLLIFRGAGMAFKFALSLYMVRYVGLADLGFYGLLSGAATAMPAIVGFGLTPWIMRHLVHLPRSQAIGGLLTRLSLSLLIQLIVQPMIWVGDYAMGEPIPLRWAPLIATILVLESLAAEVCLMLTARRHIRLSETLLFIRTSLWPVPVIVVGLLMPAMRTIEFLMECWIAGLVLAWLIIIWNVLLHQRWRHLQWHWRWLADGARESVPLYIHDLNLSIGLYLDRFVISLFLGLELTGVYTFFWSVGNMVHSLTIFGMLMPQIANLVDMGRRGGAEFKRIVRRLQWETAMWATILATGAIAVIVVMLPYLNRPLLGNHLDVFVGIMLATFLRIASDGYGNVLYALRRDDAIAMTSTAGTAMSGVLNLVLVPVAGVRGAAVAFVVTAALQLGLRHHLARTTHPGKTVAHRRPAPSLQS
jgi:O-antigen/teichoic acid export membrane protein